VPIPFYGTLWILIVAYVTKRLPTSTRICSAVMSQIRAELEEASQICGAGFFSTFRRILVPLLLPGLFVSFVGTLTMTFKALSLPVLLGHSGTELVPVLLFDLFESGRYAELSALGCSTIMIISALTLAFRPFIRRYGIGPS